MATATEPKNGVATQPPQRSLIVTLANKAGLEPDAYFKAIKATVFDSKGSQEELIAFLTVANKYDLNPFTKEIYAFPKKGGGIQPIVSVDGWANIINSHPQFDGMVFEDHFSPDGDLAAITCRIHRKDRKHPVECTEYMAECKGTSDPWRRWPRRMLRHKAMIQTGRYAFGLAGIMDPDEADRAESVGWGKEPQGKVGVSNINKLLDSMPAHKPSEAAHVAEEYTDDAQDEPAIEESQERYNPLDGFLEALAKCKTRDEAKAVMADYMNPSRGATDEQLEQLQREVDLKLAALDSAGKTKQKNLMGD